MPAKPISQEPNMPLATNPTPHPIADLHCDLLCHLARNPQHTPYDLAVRCAIPQLREGFVKMQTMAIFTETTPGSSKSGFAQLEVFKDLPRRYPDIFELVRRPEQIDLLPSSKTIGILPAIENASSFCEEHDDLETALKKLTTWQRKAGKLAYISLTWNTENRFGGGASTDIGLKNDGKRLIDYLCEFGIALDFSHTSDHLAYDILNHLDKQGLKLPLLASHSNMRTVTNVPRNLPDDLVKEILRRKGIIGLNFIRHFIGETSPEQFH